MAASDRAEFFTLAWHGFRGVKKGLSGALPEGGVNRQSFTHSCRVAMLRAARPVTRFGLSVVADWRFFMPLPPPSQTVLWGYLGHGAQARQFSDLPHGEKFPHLGWVFWLPLTIASIYSVIWRWSRTLSLVSLVAWVAHR